MDGTGAGSDPMIGRKVSHFRILSQLGAGGMGIVYLAQDEALDRKAALKFLPEASARDESVKARFLREARSASALDHPNVATVFEIGEWEGRPFIAMAYYQGGTLAGRIARGPLPVNEAASITGQIAAGLAAAHAAGIVHRDLKPANIALLPDGQVKILDFGLAKIEAVDQETAVRVTAAGTALGTVAFMAPEQVRGEDVDARADVWALGVVVYEMLTGRLPFTADNALATMQAVLTGTPPPLAGLRPDTPSELSRVVDAALEKDRARRRLTAAAVASAMDEYRLRASSGARAAVTASPLAWVRRPRVVLPAIATLALIAAAAAWFARDASRKAWAREQILVEIPRLVEAEQFTAAFDLLREAEPYVAGDPGVEALWNGTTRTATVDTLPPGAAVFYREYGAEDAPWRSLGTTPLADVRIPRGFFQWKFEADGYRTAFDVGPNPFWPPRFLVTLHRDEDVPVDMVRASAGGEPFSIFIPGLDHLPEVILDDFWIDRHEVTNREYKQFVDEGGYERPEFWTQPFVRGGRTLTREEAMAVFVDASGRPGPAGWELGSYPRGQDDLPVTGVSWYEAAAYAAYAGKALPTIFHWSLAADQRTSGSVVSRSNFSGQAALPVGQSAAWNRFGTVDMAGNVKEWTWNAADGDRRYILGGAWSEPVYMFTDADARSAFDRESTFGFRCVKLDPSTALAANLTEAIVVPSRDFRAERPVSDEVFEAYLSLYSYDRTDLDARVESTDESPADWKVERVSYAAAYGGERVSAFVFLPKQGRPPYQTIVYFPGSGAISQRSNDDVPMRVSSFDFVLRSGRAVVFPIYKGTYERGGGIRSDYPDMTGNWRDHLVMIAKDFRRTVDYVESRDDLASDRIGYTGVSWGGSMGAFLPAVEPRVRAAVLVVGGFYLQPTSPEVDAFNFAPRVRIPVLMLNGRFDFFYPTDSSQEPMFDLLGSPADRKRRVVYDTGHTIPRADLVRETIDWFDRYLGPTR